MILLLIVLSILMALISLGFIVGGIIKKNQELWISSLITFILFTSLTVYLVATSVEKTVDCTEIEEFQTNTKQES